MSTRTMLQWCGGIVLAIAVLITCALPQVSLADESTIRHDTPAYYLKRVFKIGMEYGHAETLQAILMQESRGIKHAIGNPKGSLTQRSYGLMQVQINAARSVLHRYPRILSLVFPQRTYQSLRDREIADMLIRDDDANIRIAAQHFSLYLQLCNGDWSRAVAAYNVGIGGVRRIAKPSEFTYVKSIRKKMESLVKPFNTRHDLLTTEVQPRTLDELIAKLIRGNDEEGIHGKSVD